MTITKKEYSSSDAQQIVLYAKQNGDSNIAYPVLADGIGRLIISPSGGDVYTATSSSVSIGTTSTTVLSARTDRTEAIIVNDSDSTIYLKFGTGATVNSGIRLNAAGGTLIEDIYTGEITAICSSSGKVLTVTEL